MAESSADVMPTVPLQISSFEQEPSSDSQDVDDMTVVRLEEQKLQAKYPNLAKTSVSSSFLQKQLSKGMVFDSGDYNAAKSKVQTKKPLKPEEQLQLSMINNLPADSPAPHHQLPPPQPAGSGASSPVVYSRSQSLTPGLMTSSTIGLGTSAAQPNGRPVRKPSVTSQSRLAAS
jgi:hypothetical protein